MALVLVSGVYLLHVDMT